MVEKIPSAKTKHSQNDLGGQYKMSHKLLYFVPRGGGGALGYFLGGYVPPGTPNWHPVLEKISPKIDTPF